MAIISLINYSSLENNLRLEAEYYQPKYLAIEQKLKKMNAVKIRYYTSKITDGTHFTPHYVDSGVKFYSALNVKENIFDQDDKFKYITHKTHALLYKRCTPAPEDILIRKVGVGPRWSAVIPKTTKEEFSIFVSLALLKVRKEKISPYYLSTFINSFYGQAQLLRIQKGMSQPDLHLEDIAELKIPRFDSRYESEIENLILKGLKYRQSAQSLYIQAQDLLERELGLDKFIFDKPLSYEAKLSEVVGNNRSDAEYYHAKYKPLLNLINSFRTGCLPLTKMINEIMPNIDLRKKLANLII